LPKCKNPVERMPLTTISFPVAIMGCKDNKSPFIPNFEELSYLTVIF